MNSAVETVRCIRETSMYCDEQQRELVSAVIFNARFLNTNLGVAMDKFSAWEKEFRTDHPERANKVRCMLINARKNFDLARIRTEEINQWLDDDKLLISSYSKT